MAYPPLEIVALHISFSADATLGNFQLGYMPLYNVAPKSLLKYPECFFNPSCLLLLLPLFNLKPKRSYSILPNRKHLILLYAKM